MTRVSPDRRRWLAAGMAAGLALASGVRSAGARAAPSTVAQHGIGNASTSTTPAGISLVSAKAGETAAAHLATLDDFSTELAVSLGLAPIAVANLTRYRQYVGIAAQHLATARSLGSPQQPDLDTLVRSRPDLIVGVDMLHRSLFARLASIAPTVILDANLRPDGEDAVSRATAMLHALAAFTGRQVQAHEVSTACARALAESRRRVREHGYARRPVAVLFPLTREGSFIVSNQQTLIESVMRRLDLLQPWPLTSATALHRRLPWRALAAHPDVCVLFIGGQQASPFFDTPLWKDLPVARSGRFTFLDTPYWSFGGPVSAGRLAGQIREAIERLPPVTSRTP
ncbi:ABC transporter substrate-binding protein [Achromobacter sp. GG226]|uniref:ABC transporter substrate-binding protein n=1 Tax=Verticiella alkaliphila TaxID=2779529 RepID=UPI001C0B5EDF|nr:ABC transporter substrate-binding protein [Verticiella sp. GG226]MBU4612576.1 ABC transporter substrate-binding protein [Verticiella sp. GG226]